jgi:hypothetical protein
MRGINTTGFPPVSMTHKMGIKIPEIKDFNARQWVPPMQLEVWMGNMTGEEGDYFIDKMVELSDIVKRMPLATDQEAESKPHLRYFTGDMTWHIYAKDFPYDGDSDNPNDPGNPKGDQRQAFGHADLGYGGEFGYISLVEMFEVAPSLNLDMHFTPGDARR